MFKAGAALDVRSRLFRSDVSRSRRAVLLLAWWLGGTDAEGALFGTPPPPELGSERH